MQCTDPPLGITEVLREKYIPPGEWESRNCPAISQNSTSDPLKLLIISLFKKQKIGYVSIIVAFVKVISWCKPNHKKLIKNHYTVIQEVPKLPVYYKSIISRIQPINIKNVLEQVELSQVISTIEIIFIIQNCRFRSPFRITSVWV